jgi:multiple sugar transport system ATP-binding protein
VLSGSVVGLERTGLADLVILECSGKRLTVLFQERHPIARGSTVHLRPRRAQAHLFDAATGVRLP